MGDMTAPAHEPDAAGPGGEKEQRMTAPAPLSADAGIELDIGGMTCASCANRIERKLNKLDGVVASVN